MYHVIILYGNHFGIPQFCDIHHRDYVRVPRGLPSDRKLTKNHKYCKKPSKQV